MNSCEWSHTHGYLLVPIHTYWFIVESIIKKEVDFFFKEPVCTG